MKINSKTEYINIAKELKVGVISDSQLSPFANDKVNTYQKNLIQALRTLKKKECNVILFAGDICNMASKYAYRRYKKSFAEVFGEEMPLVISVMGNHDYYGNFFARRIFEKELGVSPFSHYVINGFHFIGASPDCCSMHRAYLKTGEWLDKQLAEAVADTPDKPVFVITHHPPVDTVYGSDDWGDETLDKIFSKYPNVVDFAGHSHYSVVDERSYYTGKYRVVNTQSVSYIELERGKMNGSVPPDAHIAPMGYVMDFADKQIELIRYNLLTGEEEKQDMRWSIPYDITVSSHAKEPSAKPCMHYKSGSWYEENGATYLTFSSGEDDDFIHTYRLVYSDGEVQDYFSDFYKGIKYVSQVNDKIRLRIYGKEKGLYDIKIYAIDSYGQISEDYTVIQGVQIGKKDVYRRKLAPDIIY